MVADCSSVAADTVYDWLATSLLISSTSRMDSTTCWLPFLAASCDCSANFRTFSATTAKPRPCSPARAASIAALRASRFVGQEFHGTFFPAAQGGNSYGRNKKLWSGRPPLLRLHQGALKSYPSLVRVKHYYAVPTGLFGQVKCLVCSGIVIICAF